MCHLFIHAVQDKSGHYDFFSLHWISLCSWGKIKIDIFVCYRANRGCRRGCMFAASVKSTLTPQGCPIYLKKHHQIETLSQLHCKMAKCQTCIPPPDFPQCLDKCMLHMGYNLFVSHVRPESDENYVGNVKCSVSENIKECPLPWGARKINDPD